MKKNYKLKQMSGHKEILNIAKIYNKVKIYLVIFIYNKIKIK